MLGRDLAREVTPSEPVVVGDGDGPRVVALDTGIKTSIVRNLVERGMTVELLPCTTAPAEVLAREPDAVFLANGPGDPAALDYVVGQRARAGRARCRCGASASATSSCAGRSGSRPSSCRSATAAPTTP